jgi:hypothetical protein
MVRWSLPQVNGKDIWGQRLFQIMGSGFSFFVHRARYCSFLVVLTEVLERVLRMMREQHTSNATANCRLCNFIPVVAVGRAARSMQS